MGRIRDRSQKLQYLVDGLKEKQNVYDPYPPFPQYTKLEKYYDAWLFVDLCCRSMLQYIIQGIIFNRKNKNKLASIKKLNDVIVKMLDVELIERNEFNRKVILVEEPAENLFRFYSYFFIRDKFLQDIEILNDITEEYDQNEILVIEKSLDNFGAEKNRRSWEEIQNLFEDGYPKHNLKTFKHNVANCLFLIKKLNMMEMEGQIPYTPIRLKALYREFYLEKPKYIGKRKTGMTIVNDFLKIDNIGGADYYFIKEILNKGFFKEYGLLKEFCAKNELQENLYCLACVFLAKLRPTFIFEEFYSVAYDFGREIKKLQNEYNKYAKIREENYKDIGDFDLPVDCNNMTNEETKNIYQLLEELFGISE